MERRKQTRGECQYCGRTMTRGGISRHLADCARRKEAIAQADADKAAKAQNIYHLLVQDADDSAFWLHLEMKGLAPLRELDSYLRGIWLECCGHMSSLFAGKGIDDVEDEINLGKQAERVLQPDMLLTHIYDWGTTSELSIKVVSVRKGTPTTKHPIALMARNEAPSYPCQECGQPATWMCKECIIEDDNTGSLCDAHAKKHLHKNYGDPVAFVNSPRMGMCGYDGPAQPPY